MKNLDHHDAIKSILHHTFVFVLFSVHGDKILKQIM